MSDWTKVESGVMPTIGERVRVRFMVVKKAPFLMEGVGTWDGKEWSRLYPVIECAPLLAESIHKD
jgi:hypothetical protein